MHARVGLGVLSEIWWVVGVLFFFFLFNFGLRDLNYVQCRREHVAWCIDLFVAKLCTVNYNIIITASGILSSSFPLLCIPATVCNCKCCVLIMIDILIVLAIWPKSDCELFHIMILSWLPSCRYMPTFLQMMSNFNRDARLLSPQSSPNSGLVFEALGPRYTKCGLQVEKNRAHYKYKKNIAMTDCLPAGYSIIWQSVIAIFFLSSFLPPAVRA